MIKHCFSQSLNNDGRVAFNEKQCLTPAQKEQARKNIGLDNVPTQDDIRAIKNRLDNDETMIDDISNELEGVSKQVGTNTDNISTLQEDVLKAKSTVSAGKNIEVEEEVMADGHTNYTISASSNVFEIIPEDWGITVGVIEPDSEGHYTAEQYTTMYNNGVGFQRAIETARDSNYKNIRFPYKETICFTPWTTSSKDSLPIVLFYDIHNTFIDLNECTFRIKLDSEQKSQYYLRNLSTSYDYRFTTFAFECCTNSTIKNGTFYGDKTVRKFIVPSEEKQEWSSAIHVNHHCRNIHIENLNMNEYMGDCVWLGSSRPDSGGQGTNIISKIYPYESHSVYTHISHSLLRLHKWLYSVSLSNKLSNVSEWIDERENPISHNDNNYYTSSTDYIEINDSLWDKPSPNYPDIGHTLAWVQGDGPYMSNPNVCTSSKYNAIYFYDKDKNPITSEKQFGEIGYQYNEVNIPKETKYIKFASMGYDLSDNTQEEYVDIPSSLSSYVVRDLFIDNCVIANCMRGGVLTNSVSSYITNTRFINENKMPNGYSTDCYAISNDESATGLLYLENCDFSNCWKYSSRILARSLYGALQAINCKDVTLITSKMNSDNFSSFIRNSSIRNYINYAPNTLTNNMKSSVYKIDVESCSIADVEGEFSNAPSFYTINLDKCIFHTTRILNLSGAKVLPEFSVFVTNPIFVVQNATNNIYDKGVYSIFNTYTSVADSKVRIDFDNATFIIPEKDKNYGYLTQTLEEFLSRVESNEIMFFKCAGEIIEDGNKIGHVGGIGWNSIPKAIEIEPTSQSNITIKNHDCLLPWCTQQDTTNEDIESTVNIENCGLIPATFVTYPRLDYESTKHKETMIYKDCTIYGKSLSTIPSNIGYGVPLIPKCTPAKTLANDDSYRNLIIDNMKYIGDGNSLEAHFISGGHGRTNTSQNDNANDRRKLHVTMINCDSICDKFMNTYVAYGESRLSYSYGFRRIGNATQRPWFVPEGFQYFDTDLNKMLIRKGFRWNENPWVMPVVSAENRGDYFTDYEPGWIDMNGNEVIGTVFDEVTFGDKTYGVCKIGEHEILTKYLSIPTGTLDVDYKVYQKPEIYGNNDIIGYFYRLASKDAIDAIIPEGWHIPTKEEALDLVEYNVTDVNYLLHPWWRALGNDTVTNQAQYITKSPISKCGRDKYGLNLFGTRASTTRWYNETDDNFIVLDGNKYKSFSVRTGNAVDNSGFFVGIRLFKNKE